MTALGLGVGTHPSSASTRLLCATHKPRQPAGAQGARVNRWQELADTHLPPVVPDGTHANVPCLQLSGDSVRRAHGHPAVPGPLVHIHTCVRADLGGVEGGQGAPWRTSHPLLTWAVAQGFWVDSSCLLAGSKASGHCCRVPGQPCRCWVLRAFPSSRLRAICIKLPQPSDHITWRPDDNLC